MKFHFILTIISNPCLSWRKNFILKSLSSYALKLLYSKNSTKSNLKTKKQSVEKKSHDIELHKNNSVVYYESHLGPWNVIIFSIASSKFDPNGIYSLKSIPFEMAFPQNVLNLLLCIA